MKTQGGQKDGKLSTVMTVTRSSYLNQISRCGPARTLITNYKEKLTVVCEENAYEVKHDEDGTISKSELPRPQSN